MALFDTSLIIKVSNRRLRRRRGAAAALLAAACAAGCAAGCGGAPPQSGAPAAERPAPVSPPAPDGWESLFDGASLAGWTISDFAGRGEVRVEDGAIVLGMGEMCTGVTWTREFPRADYEIEYEAMRVEGSDFFGTVTFPVGGGAASLVLGGWGGRVTGLSCLDGYDASDNETTSGVSYGRGRWHRVRVRVAEGRVQAWINGDKAVDVATGGRRISVRPDIDACLPFGFASWRTTGKIREIRMKKTRNPKSEIQNPPSPLLPEGRGTRDGGRGGTVRVAGIVLKWIRGDKAANFRRAEPMIREAAANGAAIVVTTECFLDGYAISDKDLPREAYWPLGEPIPDGPWFRRLAALADELDIHLVAGMAEADGEDRYNAAVVLGPDGRLLGKYRKQSQGHEVRFNKPGTVSSAHTLPGGPAGIMICADRREPAIVSRFFDNGARYLLCPSGGMFGPEKNDHHLQARSRENRSWIVFVHPAEWLVTAPDGSIADRRLLGDVLFVAPEEAGGGKDSKGVFYCDVPAAGGN